MFKKILLLTIEFDILTIVFFSEISYIESINNEHAQNEIVCFWP